MSEVLGALFGFHGDLVLRRIIHTCTWCVYPHKLFSQVINEVAFKQGECQYIKPRLYYLTNVNVTSWWRQKQFYH
jgi:hypothetical protein